MPSSRGLKPNLVPAGQRELMEWREGQPLPQSLPDTPPMHAGRGATILRELDA